MGSNSFNGFFYSHGHRGPRPLGSGIQFPFPAAGADGLIIEVHPRPDEAMSDGAQSLKPERFAKLVVEMKAIAEVPRHEFVPEDEQPYAYDNRPLPIGHGQTISQPYIVAIMTDMLNLEADSKVLELGTGSGYQAAILSKLAKKVYAIEIIPELVSNARAAIDENGIGGQTAIFHAATQRHGDGFPVAQLLLERGADLTIRVKLPGYYERPDEVVECTPLGYAIRFPGTDNETVKLLRERGGQE